MKKGNIIIISGPSGAGKTTIYNKLLSSRKYKEILVESISYTTRPKRKNEKEGRDYFFVSPKMFLYKIRANHFLEYQKVFGNHYGTSNKYVKEKIKDSKFVLLCIDVKGAKVVSKKYPKALKIFIQAPSIKELRKRLLKRGLDCKETIDKRMRIAESELKESKYYDYIVMNDCLEKAYKEIKEIIDLYINPD